MDEVIYQLKTILNDLQFVQGSLTNIAYTMEYSPQVQEWASQQHLDDKLMQASQFAVGAGLRLQMAEVAFEKAKGKQDA
jgi:hypothetical protein